MQFKLELELDSGAYADAIAVSQPASSPSWVLYMLSLAGWLVGLDVTEDIQFHSICG